MTKEELRDLIIEEDDEVLAYLLLSIEQEIRARKEEDEFKHIL